MTIAMKLDLLVRSEGFASIDGLTLLDVARRRAAREALTDARRSSARTSERMAVLVRGRAS